MEDPYTDIGEEGLGTLGRHLSHRHSWIGTLGAILSLLLLQGGPCLPGWVRGWLRGWLSCFRADPGLRLSLFQSYFTSLARKKQVIYQPLLNVELCQLQPSPCPLAF